MNLDDYKTGQFDSASPINQIETEAETVTGWDNLTEAYNSGHEYTFQYVQREILRELDILLEIAKSSGSGTKNILEGLINKCK